MRRIGLVAMLLVIPSTHQGLAQGAQEAIDRSGVAWGAAFNAGDAQAVADLYTENGALYPPDGEPVNGRHAIAAYWQAAIDAGVEDGDHERLEVVESGDLAYEVGRLSLGVPTTEGAMTHVGGNYMVVWQRGDDGVWRMHRDIWNIDPPTK